MKTMKVVMMMERKWIKIMEEENVLVLMMMELVEGNKGDSFCFYNRLLEKTKRKKLKRKEEKEKIAQCLKIV